MRVHLGLVVCVVAAGGVAASNILQTDRLREQNQAISRFLVAAGYAGDVKSTQSLTNYRFPATGVRCAEGKAILFLANWEGKAVIPQFEFYARVKEAARDQPPETSHLKAAIRAAVALKPSDPVKCTFVCYTGLSGENSALFAVEAPAWHAKAILAPLSGRVRALYVGRLSK